MLYSKMQPMMKNSKFIFGLALNVVLALVIASILTDLFPANNLDEPIALGATVPRESTTPSGSSYATGALALAAANDKLDDMTVYGIHTIDDTDECYRSTCYYDYSMGNIEYWDLRDSDTTVFLKGKDPGEIIFYEHTGWVTGSMTKSQILSQAETIAGQFAALPNDRETPVANFFPELTSSTGFFEDGTSGTVDYPFWEVNYNRSKNSIIVEDHIRLLLTPNGYCSLYVKQWFTDLNGFSTNYSVPKSSAETIATNFVGAGSSVSESYKFILRPNYAYDIPPQFGNNLRCVWVVDVQDINDNLWIVFIDGQTGLQVGGDYVDQFFA